MTSCLISPWSDWGRDDFGVVPSETWEGYEEGSTELGAVEGEGGEEGDDALAFSESTAEPDDFLKKFFMMREETNLDKTGRGKGNGHGTGAGLIQLAHGSLPSPRLGSDRVSPPQQTRKTDQLSRLTTGPPTPRICLS